MYQGHFRWRVTLPITRMIDKKILLRVGDGEFAPVHPEVWDYSVSGLQVVKSWLDYRKLKRSGRKSSVLDDIRPRRWEFVEELLDLLWVLEETLREYPEGTALLDQVCSSPVFSRDELPRPTDTERQGPQEFEADPTQYPMSSMEVE